MNEHEADRIAASMHQLRPDWPIASIRTLIGKSLLSRPRRDVAVALAWVACDPKTATPARVLEAGPWWKAAGVEGSANAREPFDRGSFCAHCHQPESRCVRMNATDHEFESIHAYDKRIAAQPTRPDRRKAREDADA